MAGSSQDPTKDQDKATKTTSDTVNLTPDELRRISGGAKVGQSPPTPTPSSPGNTNSPNPNV